jgi:phosphocarrier protein
MNPSDGPTGRRVKATFTLVNQLGLHARAAAQLVNLAGRYRSEITIRKNGEAANCKSIMGVLMLAAACGTPIEFEAIGPDSEEALRRIGELVANRFGEGA